MAMNDYTDDIDGIEKDEKNHKADLKLSPEVSNAYTDAVGGAIAPVETPSPERQIKCVS